MKDRYYKSSLGKLRYRQLGESGPVVLLLLHGLGGSIENWQYNIQELAKHFKVYAIEPIGCGSSDKPAIKYTLDVMADSVIEFLRAQNFEKLSLVGNSMGGALSLKLANECPELIDKMILAGSAGFSCEMPLMFRLVSIPFLGELLFKPSVEGTRKAISSFVYDSKCITEKFFQQCYENSSRPGQVRVTLSILRAHMSIFGINRALFEREFAKFKTIKNKTLLIWGREDPIINYDSANIALKALVNSQLETFEKCGHLAQIERPKDFNQLAVNFLLQDKYDGYK